ncbi:MAG: hypothetical protein U0835_00140 [Isosphaeraceae bacterium]
MPFDVAFSLPHDEATAWAIIFGQFEGNEWDWGRMAWKENDK